MFLYYIRIGVCGIWELSCIFHTSYYYFVSHLDGQEMTKIWRGPTNLNGGSTKGIFNGNPQISSLHQMREANIQRYHVYVCQ